MIVAEGKVESFKQVAAAMTNGEISALIRRFPECDDNDVKKNVYTLCAYLWFRHHGYEHRAAAMYACQSAPRGLTDREFWEGRHNWADDAGGRSPKQMIELAKKNAAAAGLPPPPDTAVYEPGLARGPMDPRAFVSSRGELRRKCEAYGLDCEGIVKVKAHRGPKETKAGQLAPDLAAEIAHQRIAANPGLARIPRRELIADIQAAHGFTDQKRAGHSTAPVSQSNLKIKAGQPQPKRRKK